VVDQRFFALVICIQANGQASHVHKTMSYIPTHYKDNGHFWVSDWSTTEHWLDGKATCITPTIHAHS